jgi:hypothetical protein
MIAEEQLNLCDGNFAADSIRHRNQNRQLDHGRRLNRRIVRDVANRARRIRAARMMVLERRPGHHEEQGEKGQADKCSLSQARPTVCRGAHLLFIVRARTPLDARDIARVCMN